MQPPSNRFAPSTAVTRRLAAVAIAVACSGGCKPHVPALPSPESARATEGSPALKLVDRSRGDASACQIGVDAHGLPALNPDGTRVAFVEYPWCGYDDEAGCGSDLVIVPTSDGTRESRRRLEDSTRELGAYPEETDAEQCREIRERHRQRADRFTAELRGFRPLQALDVVVVDPDRLGEVDPSYIVPIADLPAAHRPVSVAVDGSTFVVEVSGVAVLHRSEQPRWSSHIDAVWGDDETGTIVVSLTFNEGGHHDDEGSHLFVTTVPPRVFDEIRRRPTDRYQGRVRAACESEPSRCGS